MFIQKIFHVHHSLSETRAQLGQLNAHRGRLEGVKKALLTADGVAQFECDISPRLNLHVVAVELPTDEPEQVLFRSTVGNIDLAGLVEFEEVRPDVTEVRLTLEYRPKAWLARLKERCFHPIEKYLERQLRSLQGCLDGQFSHSPQAVRAARMMAHLPQLAR